MLSGKLPAITRLPSVRNLAAELSASGNTVEGAYQELYAEGYIYSRHRSGNFFAVLYQDHVPLSPARNPRQHEHQPPISPEYRYDFHPARLDPASFPTALWRKCFLGSLRESSSEPTRYGEPQGEWGLRCAIQRYLERSRGVICEPDRLINSIMK